MMQDKYILKHIASFLELQSLNKFICVNHSNHKSLTLYLATCKIYRTRQIMESLKRDPKNVIDVKCIRKLVIKNDEE